MSTSEALDERLRAVERALTDADRELPDLRNSAELTGRTEELAERVDALEARIDELDAAVQAVRGYVGNVRAVNEAVEQRADAALAKAEALEDDRPIERPRPPSTESPSAERVCACDRDDEAGTTEEDRTLIDHIREAL